MKTLVQLDDCLLFVKNVSECTACPTCRETALLLLEILEPENKPCPDD